MKKVLGNILKWLTCIFLTFTVIFTGIQYYEILTGTYLYIQREDVLEEFLKDEDAISSEFENIESIFNSEGQDEKTRELYNKCPTGTTALFIRILYMLSYGKITIMSLTLGIIIGTAIYMLLDKNKKELKLVIAMYILSIVILGFIQGFLNISGEGLNLLDKWIFPDEYIIPTSIAFVLVVIIRVLRQRNIAKILNEKLEEKKKAKFGKEE